MATININKREVVKLNRNKRATNYLSNTTNSTITAGAGNLIDWADVTTDLVTINRNLHVTGNITASADVVAYVAGAVTSDVLNALSVSVPLEKSGTNIALKVNTNQLEINGNNELQIKSNVLTPAVHNQDISTINGLQTALDAKLNTSLKGSNNGLAELDVNGFVKNTQLPSYVDDVLEYPAFANLPLTGESGKIYITTSDNKTYRWSGSVYAEISASIALGETSATAYRGDRGATAYNHSQVVHNKALVGLSNVDNVSDALKPISTATATALGFKVDKVAGKSLVNDTDIAKLEVITVTADKVTLDRDLHVEGNITASKDVVGYIAGAVTSDVLSSLTGVAPLYKPSNSSVGIKTNVNQFRINAYNELEINAGVLAPAEHTHIITNVTGLQTALDSKLNSDLYTAVDVLTKIKTVDGAGSGLDADTLDGIDSSRIIYGVTGGIASTGTVNVNNITKAGFYSGNNIANAPVVGDFGLVNIPTYPNVEGNYNFQIGATLGGNNFYARSTNILGAGTWNELYTSANSNKSTVNWSANTLTAWGAIMAYGQINTDNIYKSKGLNALYRDAADTRLYGGTNGVTFADAGNGTSTFRVDNSGNGTLLGSIQGTTAKLTNLTDGYVPYHISDASGLGNSNIWSNGIISILNNSNVVNTSSRKNRLNIFTNDGNYIAGIVYNQYTNDLVGSANWVVKSRSTAIGTYVPVITNDEVTTWNYEGDDGFAIRRGATHGVYVDGTVSYGIIPMRFTWQTMNQAGAFAERMRLTSGGNLGIGTTTPAMKLSVQATTTSQAFEVIGANNGYTNVDIVGNRTTGNLGGIRFLKQGETFGFIEINPQADKSALHINTGDGAGAGSTKFCLLQNGNVGIGTIVPTSKLDIQTAGYGFPLNTGNAQTYGGLRISSPSGNVVLDAGVNGAYGAWIQATTRTDLSISQQLLLNPNGGNVGIGYSSVVSDKLAVNGSIKATTATFTTGAGAGKLLVSDANGLLSYSPAIIVTGASGTGKVVIDRDLEVTGNITASKDVISYVASAVSSSVLDVLSVSAPLLKTNTNIELKYNTSQLEVNASNEIQIKSNVLTPAVHSQDINTINGLQTALNNKANLDNPTFTGIVNGISKAMVGLSYVDNTADVNKSVAYASNAGLLDNLDSTVFVKNNSINTNDLLGLYTITKSIQLTKNWQNTGILNTDLINGMYLFTLSCNDSSVGGNYSQTYTGQVFWYAGGTNDTEGDEIILHSSGHAKNNQTIYLRTKRNSTGVQTFEIAANYITTGTNNYTFNFRRLI